MALLTSRDMAQSSAITPTTLIHIVTTADTTQSVYGSSYKAELQQLKDIFGSNPDVTVTGGTYNPSTGEVTFYNNTGGTFNVSGFITGFTDSFVSGGTYTAGTATFTNTTGGTFTVTGFNESNIYNSDGSLTGLRLVNMNTYPLAFSGGSSDLFIGFVGTGDKHLQWSETGALNWEMVVNTGSNDFELERYDISGLYQDSPLTIGFSNGYVGIKQQSPTETLDVSGKTKTINFQMTSGATTGYVLKSLDGNGNAYWANACDCPYTGGTVTGATTFSGGLSATSVTGNTIWAEKIRGKLGPIQFNDTDGGNIYFGSTSGITLDVINRRIGIGTTTPTTDLDVTGGTRTATLQVTSGATNGYVLTSDGSGNATWQASSGGVSIDPYFDSGSGSTISWNVSGQSTNYQATLTATTTLDLTNVRNGDYGTIILTQDGTGGRTLTLGTVNGGSATHRVANGGGGSVVLTSTGNAIDILTFTYNGSSMYWTVGNDYT